ncbi:MAG: FkbM family methyltransferase [Acidobacteria bacterium]|nr:MAG: FkbM family methyltransferase [Acidobacteriota bacterium]
MIQERVESSSCDVDPKFLELAKSLGIKSPIICDIGSRDASEGIFLLGQLGGARLHVFEPNPASAARCRENLAPLQAEYGVDKIAFSQVAASDRNGSAAFYPVNLDRSENKDIGCSSLFRINPKYTKRRGHIAQEEIVVETITLDSYFTDRQPPDILWIDVEGAELKVLHGAASILKNVKLIHVEVSFRAMHVGKPLFWEVDSYLRQCAFRFVFLVETSPFRGFLYRHKLLPNLPWHVNAVYVQNR